VRYTRAVRAATCVVLVTALAGCGKGAPNVCAETKSKFFECVDGASPQVYDKIHDTCVKGRSIAPFQAMFRDCANAGSCADFRGCFERHGCKLILEGPDSRSFELMCDLPTPER